jgi:hypothetical protein
MNRRGFVGTLLAAPLLGWAGDLLAKSFQYPGSPPSNPGQFPGSSPPTTPPIPGRQGPQGMPPMPEAPAISPRMIMIYHQKQLKKDVNTLYQLAGKLRNQVNKTDSTEVLSLHMLETAEEIEKLAKHIRDLARD